MNDFDYDCYQKKVTARSAKNKVRPKKGCTLPSDYLTEAEKKKLNGEVEIMNQDSLKRPIKYRYFKMLSKEQQEGYLNWLFEVYDVTLKDIGKMMEVKGNTLTKYCNSRNLDILKRPGHITPKKKIDAWNEFCGIDISEIAEEGLDLEAFAPIDYETFKKLKKSVQESYLTRLVQKFAVTKADIAKMMGAVPVTFRLYISTHELDIQVSKPKKTKDKKAAWHKFCGIDTIKQENSEPVIDIVPEEIAKSPLTEVFFPDGVEAAVKKAIEECKLLEEAKSKKKEQLNAAVKNLVSDQAEEDVTGIKTERDPVMDILPEKSPREKTLVNYEYHMEFRNLRRWGELFEVLRSMPLPEDGVVHIEVSSRKPEEKANPIGFTSPPKTTEV